MLLTLSVAFIGRQQLKWLASGAAVSIVGLVLAAAFATSSGSDSAAVQWLGDVAWFGLAALPVSIGVRLRVQRVVDRRFNRTRYNADRTVAAFAAGLKDAMDVTAVREDLTSVVQQTLEPAHVSLWISPPA